jgi:hypothetical protein
VEYWLSFQDLIWFIILFSAASIWANNKMAQEQAEKPYYKYFKLALRYRMFMNLTFLGIYIFVYGGGDTLDYFQGARAMKNLFWSDLSHYWIMMTEKVEFYMYYTYFNPNTDYPATHLFRRSENFTVIRLGSIPSILTNGSLIGINLFFAFFSFKSAWRLYEVFVTYFPQHEKWLAFAILFIPSPAFWGSGLMKDTISLIGVGYMVYYLHRIFVLKEGNTFINFFFLLANAFLIYIAKSYILIAMLPGALIWANFDAISRVKSTFVKVFLFPVMLLLIIGGGFQIYLASGSFLGDYGSDKILERAVTTQQDLVREEAYGANKFDIGAFEPTLPSILGKFPVATNAGLYRPYIWETNNITMAFSGLENLILLYFSLVILFKLGPIGLIRKIFGRPLLTFCFLFSILLAFSIGLTTANFGAMVRYKIPLIPFFTAMIIILVRESSASYKREQQKKELAAETESQAAQEELNPI